MIFGIIGMLKIVIYSLLMLIFKVKVGQSW